eukprot:TRINITY_DN53_c0_g1_i1.p1 TRINITY_DN53_c0_g1~~TRINITY_DN53_c0_g1_i1.p1  ORF type:complete len:247 (-),score=-40.95 TRINITY_DN53_c0_g1_i1:1365-2105(-)
MLTYRCPFLPPLQQRRSRQCPQPSGDAAGNCRRGSRSLPDLTGCFTVRTDDGHAPPLSQSCKTFRLTIIQLSYPVRCPALIQLNRRLHLLWCSPANSFKFQPCDRTSQVVRFTISLRRISNAWLPTHLTHIVYGWDYRGIQSRLLPQLSSLTVEAVLVNCLRHRSSLEDYKISLLPPKYGLPLPVPRLPVSLRRLHVKREDFPRDLTVQLRTLQTQQQWPSLEQPVLPRRLAPVLPCPFFTYDLDI